MNGPIFYDGLEIETIGDHDEIPVPIPHALFKVIVFEVEDDLFVRAFLFPQPSYKRVRSIMASNGGKVPNLGYRSCEFTDQDAV